MPKTAYAIALAAVLAALAPSFAHAQSQRAFVDPYLAAKITLGLGGSVTASGETAAGSYENSEDLTVSFGVGAQYLYPLHEYFSLGGMLDFQSWRSTAEAGCGMTDSPLLFPSSPARSADFVVFWFMSCRMSRPTCRHRCKKLRSRLPAFSSISWN